MIKSSGVDEARSSSMEDISEIKTDWEDFGGRYIISRVNDEKEMVNFARFKCGVDW